MFNKYCNRTIKMIRCKSNVWLCTVGLQLKTTIQMFFLQEVPCGEGGSEGLTEGSDLINNAVLLHDRDCTSYSSAREIPFMCKTSFLLLIFLSFMFVLWDFYKNQRSDVEHAKCTHWLCSHPSTVNVACKCWLVIPSFAMIMYNVVLIRCTYMCHFTV